MEKAVLLSPSLQKKCRESAEIKKQSFIRLHFLNKVWGQIGDAIRNGSHSVTYRRIRQTVSPPLDFPKMLTRDALKMVFFLMKGAMA